MDWITVLMIGAMLYGIAKAWVNQQDQQRHREARRIRDKRTIASTRTQRSPRVKRQRVFVPPAPRSGSGDRIDEYLERKRR